MKTPLLFDTVTWILPAISRLILQLMILPGDFLCPPQIFISEIQVQPRDHFCFHR